MKPFIFIYALCMLLHSCSFNSEETAVKKAVTGNWLVLYPDEAALTSAQLNNYGPVQDSLVRQYGLRLLQLKKDGSFTEPDDYFNEPGSWQLYEDKKLIIKSSQPGYELYIASLQSFKKNQLRLLHTVAASNDSLPIFWVMKKITGDQPANELFTKEMNSWRKQPAAPEDEQAIRQRLQQVLRWSALYFETVAAEAIYFSPGRVVLPYNYYAHGMGLRSLEDAPAFAALFYNQANARQAMGLLQKARQATSEKYPRHNSYVKEYAQYFSILAEAL